MLKEKKMTVKRMSEDEKLKAKWEDNWSEEWQWIFNAVAKEVEIKKMSNKQKILNEFFRRFSFFTENEKNCHYNKVGSHENKCVVNQYVSKNDKVELRTINFDALGKKAKLVTIAHGSKAGVEAYLKNFSSKLTKDETVDVRHKFFTDMLLNVQPSSIDGKNSSKESYFCTIQTAAGLATFRLTKKYDKNKNATGKISEYNEICDIPSIKGRVNFEK